MMVIAQSPRHLGQPGTYSYALPRFTVADGCDWLWQQTVKVSADEAYQYALTEGFAYVTLLHPSAEGAGAEVLKTKLKRGKKKRRKKR